MTHYFGSFRFHLILLVFISVLPALGLIFYSASEQRRMAVATVQSDSRRLTRLIAEEHEQFIEGARQLLVAISRFRRIQEHDTAACNEVLADLLTQYPNYNNFSIFDLSGELFCSALPQERPLNLADRPWFKRVTETHAFTVGEYQVSPLTGKPIVGIAHPILDKAGRPAGVAAISLDLTRLSQFAAQANLPEGAVLIVIDRTGTILSRYPDPDTWVGKTMPETPLIRDIFARHEGLTEVEGVDGIPRIYAFEPVHDKLKAEQVGIFVSIGIPKASAFAEADRSLRRNLIGLGVVAVLALTIMWIGGEVLILHRLDKLLRATKRLSVGDLGIRTGIPHTKSEIGSLASAFDEMAESLELRIAERDRTEEMLRTTQDRLQFLLSASPAVIYTSKPSGDFGATFVSENVLSQTGYLAREFIDDPGFWVDHVHPEDARQALTQLESLSSNGEISYEYRFMHKDGSYRWMYDETRLIRDDAGNLKEMIGFWVDITRRKQAEEALYESEQRFRQFAENARDAIWIADKDAQRLLYVNPAYEAIWGGPCAGGAEAVAAFFESIVPDDRDIVIRRVDRNARWIFGTDEYRIRRPDGTIRWIRDRSFPIRDSEGNVHRVAGIAEDITEQIEMEAQLRRTQDMKLLGQIAAGVAHEVRNPLNAILSISEALFQEIGDNPEYQPYIEHIRSQVSRLALLMKDLLDLGKPIQPSSVRSEPLSAFFRTTIDLWNQAHPSAMNRVRVVALPGCGDDLCVKADSQRLQQVFLNLLENATQHSSEGGEIMLQIVEVTGDSVRIYVIDQGAGIPPENLSRVFEPFFSTRRGGSGLGLSLVKHFIESMGGKVAIRNSDTPPGCTVELTLRIAGDMEP